MKYLKELLLGKPLKGEPINYETGFKTIMPPDVSISFSEWEAGSWINNIK